MPGKPYGYKKKDTSPEAELSRLIANAEKNASVAEKNRISRAAGKEFEGMIDRACSVYRDSGKAMIVKVPENRRVVGRTGDRNSAMICVNAEKAHPDYMGSVSPHGRTIVFDAKHTGSDRIMKTALSSNQAKILDAHAACGAWTFVAVSFGFEAFYLIPYVWWRDMKAVFGRMYIRRDDAQIQRCRIPCDRNMRDHGRLYVWFLGRPGDTEEVFARIYSDQSAAEYLTDRLREEAEAMAAPACSVLDPAAMELV